MCVCVCVCVSLVSPLSLYFITPPFSPVFSSFFQMNLYPTRCAVGGHSYGSFMTSHLLSHTSLFAAGIGRSGAFNRTLTPMSFQSEDRSIWEAQETYIAMSPLMHVKKYSEQKRVGKLLLIHGEKDENSGTHPLQSERYFAALKAFGIESRLCMLPHERHSYRAKESILHMAWEQEEWLKSLECG